MSRTRIVSDSVIIAADAETIWAAVADPSQMPRWSPENTGAEVDAPGSPLRAGAVFVGSNKRGRARWHTRCVVTESVPGQRFAFDVVAIGVKRPRLTVANAGWDYRFEALDDATTRVSETWTDHRGWPDAVAGVFDRVVTRGQLFADFQRHNVARTLARLKDDFEN